MKKEFKKGDKAVVEITISEVNGEVIKGTSRYGCDYIFNIESVSKAEPEFIPREEWKDIPGYERMYQVSNLGRVKSLERTASHFRGGERKVEEKIFKDFFNDKGYRIVFLSKDGVKKTFKISTLVAICFLGHTPCGYKLVINHKDFNRANDNVENLELITQRENSNQKHLKSSSKYVGVSWCKKSNKWYSSIKINGKKINLGYYQIEEDASNAYQCKLNEINSKEENAKEIQKTLENGKVYKHKSGWIAFKINDQLGFGFEDGNFFNEVINFTHHEDYEEFPISDFKTLLIAEAEKRGFKSGVCFKSLDGYNNCHTIGKHINFWPNENDSNEKILALRISADEKDWSSNGGKGCSNPAIFKNGIWAEIIPTITKQEAEQKLGVKIIE